MKLGFRSKIYLGIVLLLVLLSGLILLVVREIMTEALLAENRRRGVSIGTGLAVRAAEPILAGDFLRMKVLVDETAALSDDIAYTFLLDRHGHPLTHTFRDGFPVELRTVNPVRPPFSVRLLDTGDALIYDYAVPVTVGADRVGTVRLGLLRTGIEAAVGRLMRNAVMATGIVIFIAFVVGAVFVQTVIQRIRILHRSSREILKGNLDVRTAPVMSRNCWDMNQCSRTDCPAYGDRYQRCWYVKGTRCPQCTDGEYAEKITACQNCAVYRSGSGDEIQSLAESFDAMARSLKRHIAGLREAERVVREQKELLRTILNATPDFVCLQDRNGIYRSVNPAFCRLTELPREQIIGFTDQNLFSPKRAGRYQEENRQVVETGVHLQREDRLRRNGRDQWFHVVKLPVRDVDGRIIGILWSGRDITEMKVLQARLMQTQKMESLGQLAAGVAHEINTPLGIILGYAQLLGEDIAEDNPMRQDLEIIERQSKICRKIVADLLSFSRRAETRRHVPVDMNGCIDEVVTVVAHTFQMDRVRIEKDYDEEIPLMIGDQDRLRQVFMNLLNNARDAIGKDGLIRVRTRYEPSAGDIVISISDTGCGVPAQHIDHIFDPFFTTKAVDKGTGLGLAVSFGIVQEHGGRIEAESPAQPDADTPCGTTFRIYLPAAGEEIQEEQQDGRDTGTG